MAARTVSSVLAPVMLVADAMFIAWNWSIRPERGVFWIVAALTVAGMFAAWLRSRRYAHSGGARQRSAEAVLQAIVFGGLMLAIPLGLAAVSRLAAPERTDISHRAVMAILGAFFVATGNAFPKTLTPLAALRCDAAGVQAFQRFAGWTWVLMGLVFGAAWIVLPTSIADPVSTVALFAGMLIIAARVIRLRRSRPHAV